VKARRTPGYLLRAEAKALVAEWLDEALSAEKVSQIDIAAATGAGRSHVQRWCDPNELATITAADIPVIGRSYPGVARRLVAHLADSIGYELRAQSDVADERAGLGLVHRALDAIRCATETDADGKIEDDERRREEAALDALDEAIALRRAQLRANGSTSTSGVRVVRA